MTALAGTVALITGASRGLGERIASAYWAAGAGVCLVARDAVAVSELAKQLAASPVVPGQKAGSIALDITAADAPERMVRAAIDQCGGLDTLVCNAAVQGPVGRLWETDWKAWTESFDVNLLAQVALCRAAIPALLRARRGSIILLSGGGATGPRPNFTSYATAKAGLVRFAETLAHELADTAVTVNCIAPGAMPTRMLQDVADAGAARAGAREYEAAQKALDGGDVVMERAAALAVFLASEQARAITGRLISAPWDNWEAWPDHAAALQGSDLYTLRRIVGRDRGQGWGDQ